MNTPVLDYAAVGVGPANMSLAALAHPVGVDGLAAFLAVACAIAVPETSAGALQTSLTDALVGKAERARVSAQMRSLFNLGFLGGAALAGAAIAAVTSTALYATVLANAALQLVSVAVLLGMRLPAGAGPRVTAVEAPGGVLRSAALRAVRYVAVALVCGALELYHPLLTVGLPLWIVTATDAPALLVSALLILDTVLVLLFQVASARARVLRRERHVCCAGPGGRWGRPAWSSR
ncbi:hypothetical protein ACFYOA_04800 [Streptomyces iakyrus]|uniref:hypothetical protein n=1 Tax=Streptomyces iakyrus TaxID=68219 RepID=UPI00368D953D